ncbi:MAG TPA: protein translocase subunit SecD [Patescibacteria group bacterium]|nr:protein translocase subunit SecD [Patescibacteria group bacterium]
MKKPTLFVYSIFLLAAVLLFFDFPVPIKIGKTTLDPAHPTINAGPVHLAPDFSYRLGLDLQGGTSLTYKVDMKGIPVASQADAFDGARTVIDRRINFFGVSEPTIQSLKLPGEYRIVIDLPGATNVDEALSLIGATAQLTFWEGGTQKIATSDAFLLPIGMTSVYGTKPIATKLTGKDLQKAQVVYGSQNGTPQVQLNFSSAGSKYFADITQRNVGKPVAIVLDNSVVSAPVVQQAILNGSAVISGNFTDQTAKNLAIQLNAGALPAPLKLIGQTTVGPSLGISSLKKSLVGGVIGLVSVLIFMVFLYRREGAIAGTALLIYTVIVLFIFKVIPITLTLAGIAGLILSIGMAVDANILIFERMREEIRAGKPNNIALKLGFSRAWPSIRDSNISSLITTFILFYFGSGQIRGFAVALGIGIAVSMFSAILVTRNLLRVFEKDL